MLLNIFTVDDNAFCRTNLCSDQSRGLLCPPKSSIHVTDLRCGSDSQHCPWNLHHIIYPTCEGKHECHASGLRILGLEKICRVHSFVIADYICVQSKFSSFMIRICENVKGRMCMGKSSKSK